MAADCRNAQASRELTVVSQKKAGRLSSDGGGGDSGNCGTRGPSPQAHAETQNASLRASDCGFSITYIGDAEEIREQIQDALEADGNKLA